MNITEYTLTGKDGESILLELPDEPYYYGRRLARVCHMNEVQAFYQSSGRNSFQPKTWFPFSGIRYPDTAYCWFDKSQFQVEDYHKQDLNRFGIERWKNVSDAISSNKDIPQIDSSLVDERFSNINPFEYNIWVNYCVDEQESWQQVAENDIQEMNF